MVLHSALSVATVHAGRQAEPESWHFAPDERVKLTPKGVRALWDMRQLHLDPADDEWPFEFAKLT